jgi:hypothetical protein
MQTFLALYSWAAEVLVNALIAEFLLKLLKSVKLYKRFAFDLFQYSEPKFLLPNLSIVLQVTDHELQMSFILDTYYINFSNFLSC